MLIFVLIIYCLINNDFMKRTLLASLLSVLSAAAFAQNYSFIDEYGSDVTFATQTYWIPSVSLDTREFAVVNNTTSTVTVKVRKTIISLNDPGATAYFCTDINCYGPTTSLSVNVTVYPGDDFLLTTDFNPDSVAGIAQVRYAVINQANLSDTTFFNIDYNITNGPASVRPNSLVKATITDPMPNPASSVFTMGYKLGTY